MRARRLTKNQNCLNRHRACEAVPFFRGRDCLRRPKKLLQKVNATCRCYNLKLLAISSFFGIFKTFTKKVIVGTGVPDGPFYMIFAPKGLLEQV